MPELPEVETVCQGLKPLIGKMITDVVIRRKDLRYPLQPTLSAILKTSRIVDIKRRAKYILIHLNNDQILAIHLGMSGTVRIEAQQTDYRKHDHVILHMDNRMQLTFHDPRRFGMMEYFPITDIKTHKRFSHLGVEPLSKAFNVCYLAEQLAGKRQTIKTAIMDQRLVVGVGNIYACESLFKAGISPTLKASELSRKAVTRLHAAIVSTLQEAIQKGGSSLKDYRNSDDQMGYFQHHFQVYDRDGKICTACDGNIIQMRQAGRSTYYCPDCQT